MSPAAITRQPSDALQTNSSSQPQRQSPSVVNVADACPSKPLMVARTHQPARPPTGHHNCRRPDSVIVALHPVDAIGRVCGFALGERKAFSSSFAGGERQHKRPLAKTCRNRSHSPTSVEIERTSDRCCWNRTIHWPSWDDPFVLVPGPAAEMSWQGCPLASVLKAIR